MIKKNTLRNVRKNISELKNIPLRFSRVAEGVYLISLRESLSPGEYVFKVKKGDMSYTMREVASAEYEKGYCFAVK